MKLKLVYLAFLIFILSCACEKEKVAPCLGKKPTTADFYIWIGGYSTDAIRKDPLYLKGQHWINYSCDTLIMNYVTLEAKQDSSPSTRYEWKIGANKYYKRALNISFTGRKLSDIHIPVRLKVTQEPNRACFPSDSGKANITKQLVFLGANEDVGDLADSLFRNSLVKGTFVGDFDDNLYGIGYWYDLSRGQSERKVFKNDTLIVTLGNMEKGRQMGFWFRHYFYFTDFKRKNLFKDTEHLFLVQQPFVTYKQIADDDSDLGFTFFLTPDNNTVEFRVKDKLFFKGKRIK